MLAHPLPQAPGSRGQLNDHLVRLGRHTFFEPEQALKSMARALHVLKHTLEQVRGRAAS